MRNVLVIILLSLIIFQGFSQVLSQWRGPERNGIYPETNLLNEWPKEGLVLLWSKAGLPKGFSTPVISEKTVYITGVSDTVDVIIAIGQDKEIRWKTAYGRAWKESYSESRGTPTIEGDKIYVASGAGDVSCLNTTDGKIIWQVKAFEKFEGTCGRWGLAESLLLVDNKVIFTVGGQQTTVIALDKSTGVIIWTTESLNNKASFASSLLIERNGKKQIIAQTDKYIFAIGPDKGNIIWKFDFGEYADPEGKRNNNTITPLYSEGKLYVTSGYNHSGVMLNLSDDGTSVTLAWSDKTLDTHHGGVVKVGNYIYGSNWLNNGMGNWACLDWSTGKVMWETEWINKGSIISADGLLYLYEEKNGNLALVKPSPDKLQIISSFKIPLGTGPHWAHPSIKDGVLYVRHGEALMAFDIKKK